MMRYLIVLAVLPIAACGSPSDEGVGGVSASEASALNDAAAMLDAQKGEASSDDAGLNPAAIAAARASRARVTPSTEALANSTGAP